MIYKPFLFKRYKKKVLCENLAKGREKDQKTYSRLHQATERPHQLNSGSPPALGPARSRIRRNTVACVGLAKPSSNLTKPSTGKSDCGVTSVVDWLLQKVWRGTAETGTQGVHISPRRRRSTCCVVLSCTSPPLVFAAPSSVCCFLKADDFLCVCVCVCLRESTSPLSINMITINPPLCALMWERMNPSPLGRGKHFWPADSLTPPRKQDVWMDTATTNVLLCNVNDL